jgi:hypothetical protein
MDRMPIDDQKDLAPGMLDQPTKQLQEYDRAILGSGCSSPFHLISCSPAVPPWAASRCRS